MQQDDMQQDMQEDYYGTKRVTAWPYARSTQQTSDGAETFQDGYSVRYADGYTSWSPKEVFEAAYQPLNALSFSHALQALKEGHKVARAEWNGSYLINSTLNRAISWDDMLAEDWQIVD